jgi:hypothetical protein
MRTLILTISLILIAGCAKLPKCDPVPKCRIFQTELLGRDAVYDAYFDRDNNGDINLADYADYMRECS